MSDKLSGKKDKAVGRPQVLTVEEEKLISERLVFMAIWGYPLTTRDLCSMVKDYLDALGRTSRNLSNLSSLNL